MTHHNESGTDDLKGMVVRGVGWMMASQAATQVLALITSVLVARFLGPRDVGLAAEALVFASLALIIVDFGFGSALVQRPTLSEEDKSTIFWAGLGLGAALTLVGVALSGPIASLYGEPRVQPLFAVLSLSFLLTAPGIVQGALLTRELQFRSLEQRSIIATAVSCAAGVALAALGFGPWAIVAQTLVIAGTSTALLWRASPWRPRAVFSTASVRAMAAYTSQVFGTKALAWGTENLDNLLIGRFLGATPLGIYTIAYSLMIAPVKRVASPVAHVFFPAFSRMSDRRRIADAWMGGSRMVALVVVPVMLGLIPVASDLVDTVFGEQWHEAAPVIQILASVGLIQALSALNYGILQSVAETRLLFQFSLVLSIATVAAFALGLSWGLEGVAWAYLVVTVTLHPIFLALTARVVGITVREWLHSISGVLQAGGAMLAAVFAASRLAIDLDLPAGLRLVALIGLGAAVYVPLIAWRAPEVGVELRELRDRRRRGRQQGDAPSEGTS